MILDEYLSTSATTNHLSLRFLDDLVAEVHPSWFLLWKFVFSQYLICMQNIFLCWWFHNDCNGCDDGGDYGDDSDNGGDDDNHCGRTSKLTDTPCFDKIFIWCQKCAGPILLQMTIIHFDAAGTIEMKMFLILPSLSLVTQYVWSNDAIWSRTLTGWFLWRSTMREITF